MKEELKGSLESGQQQDAVGAELKRSERSAMGGLDPFFFNPFFFNPFFFVSLMP